MNVDPKEAHAGDSITVWVVEPLRKYSAHPPDVGVPTETWMVFDEDDEADAFRAVGPHGRAEWFTRTPKDDDEDVTTIVVE